MTLEDPRQKYTQEGLRRCDVPREPFSLFSSWLERATDLAPENWGEPAAMTLATSSTDGQVAARVVLLRGYDARQGFVFYTSYDSMKAGHLETNPTAALVFYWGFLERQIRITGNVFRVSRQAAARSFCLRRRTSQMVDAVSQQSQEVASRDELERAVLRYQSDLGDREVPIPSSWCGYSVSPDVMEFWQGRTDGIHDRLVYRRVARDEWTLHRLSP